MSPDFNQAELLLHAFAARYLTRGEWASQQALIDHLLASAQEYNHQYAHPFEWAWTRRHMHTWLDAHRQ